MSGRGQGLFFSPICGHGLQCSRTMGSLLERIRVLRVPQNPTSVLSRGPRVSVACARYRAQFHESLTIFGLVGVSLHSHSSYYTRFQVQLCSVLVHVQGHDQSIDGWISGGAQNFKAFDTPQYCHEYKARANMQPSVHRACSFCGSQHAKVLLDAIP
jgi:hypothetical protein